jgi:sigma-B regulation protein RsbU (phosphoserine phosphatase)
LLAAPMLDFGARPVGVIQAVNKITKEFTDEDLVLIRLLADQAGVAVQRNRLQIAAMAAAELKREMDLARKVQEAMLPGNVPPLSGFDIAGWAKPASITGGDCYDLWPLADGRLGIFLGDASGHGIAPTLVVSQARTLVRALCDASVGKCDPHGILNLINARMTQDLEPTRFITAFLGFLSPDGSLQWQSAGHGPIFFRQSGGADVQLLEAPVPPLNALSELPNELPEPLKLGHGGELIVMSDGIFESFNPTNQLFGAERVVNLLNRATGAAVDCITQLRAELIDWQKKEDPIDDQTIVIVKRA